MWRLYLFILIGLLFPGSSLFAADTEENCMRWFKAAWNTPAQKSWKFEEGCALLVQDNTRLTALLFEDNFLRYLIRGEVNVINEDYELSIITMHSDAGPSHLEFLYKSYESQDFPRRAYWTFSNGAEVIGIHRSMQNPANLTRDRLISLIIKYKRIFPSLPTRPGVKGDVYDFLKWAFQTGILGYGDPELEYDNHLAIYLRKACTIAAGLHSRQEFEKYYEHVWRGKLP